MLWAADRADRKNAAITNFGHTRAACRSRCVQRRDVRKGSADLGGPAKAAPFLGGMAEPCPRPSGRRDAMLNERSKWLGLQEEFLETCWTS